MLVEQFEVQCIYASLLLSAAAVILACCGLYIDTLCIRLP